MADRENYKKNLRRKKKRKKKSIWPGLMLGLIGLIALGIILIAVLLKGSNASTKESLADQTQGQTTEAKALPVYISTEASQITSAKETEKETLPSQAVTETETFEETTVQTLPDSFYESYSAPGRLPAIYITTEGGQGITSKENYISGTFVMNSNGAENFRDVSEVTMRIRGRGNTTWLRYEKKSFKINFDTKINLMGDEKDKDWLLIANYYDRTLTRNNLALQLAKSLSNLKYTCDSYPVDVYINGQYWGVYDLCEQMEVAGGRIDIERDKEAEDSGFFVEIFGDNPEKNMNIGSLKDVTIKYPKEYSESQKNYISSYIQRVDSIITSGANLSELDQYVNIDSFMDWILLMEFTYNWDASFTRNVYMYKAAGGKMEFGPAWDFDYAMGSFGYDDPTYQSWALSQNGLVGITWVTYLYNNPEFMERLKARWMEVRETLMARVDSYLDQILPVLDASYNLNYQRWMLPVDGQNIQWEWETEYSKRTLPELYEYLQQFFDYRYYFLNNALVDGNYPVPKEKAV